MKLIDLSQTIEAQMPVYPGDIPITLAQSKNLVQDGYVAYRLEAGLHVGTHIDMPKHFVEDEFFCADFSVDNFAGPGIVLDVRGENPIAFKPHYADIIKPGHIVLLHTGHDHLFKIDPQKYYTGYPAVDMDFIRFLAERRIKILGMDCCSPDYAPFEAHNILLSQGIFILENLTNLGILLDLPSFEVFALPLKIVAEGSFVRAVAKV